jgi:branched-chain amino acid transport system substrate-binding protein
MKEGYSATAPDLSSLVTKLKRARPDVIFHTGYNPDITLFARQAREQGLKFGALVGHGAGYGVYEKLKEGMGSDVNYVFNIDPISIWLANQAALDPKLPPVIKMVSTMGRRGAGKRGDASAEHTQRLQQRMPLQRNARLAHAGA